MTGYLGPRGLLGTISETDGLKLNLSQVLLLTELWLYSDIFLPKLYRAEPSSLFKILKILQFSAYATVGTMPPGPELST